GCGARSWAERAAGPEAGRPGSRSAGKSGKASEPLSISEATGEDGVGYCAHVFVSAAVGTHASGSQVLLGRTAAALRRGLVLLLGVAAECLEQLVSVRCQLLGCVALEQFDLLGGQLLVGGDLGDSGFPLRLGVLGQEVLDLLL